MGKIFNIAGPCNPDKHYMLPATARLPDVGRFIDDEAYFVVHAHRQCGKTTAFRILNGRIKPFTSLVAKEILKKGRQI